jgi:hypothetical protein
MTPNPKNGVGNLRTKNVVLTPCNTISLAANVPQRLVAPVAGRYTINLSNLGPGTLYYRFDGDPTVNDPLACTMAQYACETDIHLDGVQGIGVITDQTGQISIRGRIL